MPFPMKIQPIDCHSPPELVRNDPVKPVAKSRLKRLFERQFPSVLRASSAEKPGNGEPPNNKDVATEFEPSSVCLAKMVQNFIEENNEKQPAASKCGRNRCNCFNGNCSDSSDDEFDIGFGESIHPTSSVEVSEVLKSLIPCASMAERNLLADTAKIVEKNKICKGKDDFRKIVTDGLLSLGYNVSICKSRWDKSSSCPAGEYEYLDVIVEDERLLIDIDFKSEFEIARSTVNYKAILQALPYIFVGKADRLRQIIAIVSEAAKQSLKRKGMHVPPWRKAEYVRAKWLSPYTRIASTLTNQNVDKNATEVEVRNKSCVNVIDAKSFSGDFELIFGEKNSPVQTESESGESKESSLKEEKTAVVASQWQPPAIKPRSSQGGGKIVTGLASAFTENP